MMLPHVTCIVMVYGILLISVPTTGTFSYPVTTVLLKYFDTAG